MADIEDIENLEPGYSVRAKLNASIAEANKVDGIRTDLDVHVEDKNNPHDTNFGNIQGDPADANIPHDALIDVTPDQHHPQLHDLDSHTDVVISDPKSGHGLFFADDGTWVNRTSDTETWPTGLANGGELNIGPGINDIEVIAGAGVIMDNYTDPLAPPAITGITWPQINEAITAAPAVAGSIVWFSIYDTGVAGLPINNFPTNVGALRQYPEAPSPTLGRQEIFLGTAVHNGVTWNEISNPKVVNQAAETLREVATTVLPLTTILSGAAINELPNFELDQTEGIVWENNRNWHVDKSDPNREALPAQSPMQFQYVNRDFTIVGTLTSTVDPTLWDNNGVVEAVPGPANETTIQRLYLDPANNYWILYGQFTYPSFDTANANLFAETPVVPFLLQQSVLLGYIIAEKAKTDWDIDEAIFVGAASGPGSSGTGGSPITVHDNLTGITPDNHHNQVHLLYGTDHSDVDSTGTPTLRDGLYWNDTAWALDRRTRAAGDYVVGVEYQRGDEVYDGANLSECLLDGTSSPPFVTPIGEDSEIYQGTMADAAPQLAKLINFGIRIPADLDPAYIKGYRVWTVTGNQYSVYSVRDPGGASAVNTLLTFTATADGWQDISIPSPAIYGGTVGFDVIAQVAEPDPTPVELVYNYNYQTPQNIIVPPAGQISHGRAQPDVMNINHIDSDAVDRTAQITGLTVGDTITVGNLTWAVQANQDNTTYSTVNVAPAAVSATIGVTPVTFETKVETPITIGEDPLYWDTEPAPRNLIRGLIGVDTSILDTTENGNAYGIDVIVQDAAIPDTTEWRLKIVGGISTGGGSSGFTPTTFAGAGTTGYVPDPITEQEYFLRDDGSWQKAGGGATEALVIQDTHGFTVGQAIAHNGTIFTLAQANDIDTTALGVVVEVVNTGAFKYAISGTYDIGAHGYTVGDWYYLSASVPGGVEPTEPAISQPLLYIETASQVVIYPYRPSVSQPASLPMIGEIKQYYGDLLDLTPGWHECDGTNGTPDLRDRVVMGAGSSYAYDSTGGAASAPHQHTGGNGAFTLTFSELPSHNHPMFQSGTGSGDLVNGFQSVAAGRAGSGDDNYKMAGYTPGGTPTLGYTGNQGGGASHTHPATSTSNVAVPTLPPYRALYNIMYIGV